jgi:hypothetical protein
MGGIVVDDEMDVEFRWHIGLDVPQEGEELLLTMARLARSKNRAIEHVECREQGCGAVPFVVVSDAFGEHGLRTIERLDLAFFIDAEDERLVGRIEIEADHIAQLLDEEGIGRELEAAGPVRLQPEDLEDAMDRALGQARPLAMVRTLQCLPVLGLLACVLVRSSPIASSSMVRGRPLRNSSYRPSRRWVMNRLRHLPTVCGPTPRSAATALLLRSFSHAKTMRARSVSADGRLRARTIDRRCARPSSLINSVLFGRPLRIGSHFVKIPGSDPILMSRTFGTEH